MKILQVVPYFHWSYGGPVKVVFDISRELVNKGHEVSIYTTDVGMGGKLDNNSQIKIENVETKYFKCLNNWIAQKMKLHISPAMQAEIKKNIKNYDVVHLHEWRGIPNIYVWYYAKKYKVPYVLQAHGASPTIIGNQNKIMTISKLLFDTIIGKKIIKESSKFIALTKSEADKYKKLGIKDNKIEVIPNGIDLAEYANPPTQGEFKKKNKIKEYEKIILYLGRIDNTKGIDLLIDVFSDLLNEIHDIKLVIIGPDYGFLKYLKNKVKKLKIEDHILFKDPVYDQEKYEAYRDAFVFVTPSFFGFPLTFIESCALGTPIITTNKSEKLEWIKKIGFIVEYDKKDLKNAISILLNNNKLRNNLSKKCENIVKEQYNWSNIAKKLETLYEKIII
ncbi:MAG: glycosyltransferase [Methanobacteriaceae archaeon]|nr:glycosyltransferase [Methanobacteriaceae archaeon]